MQNTWAPSFHRHNINACIVILTTGGESLIIHQIKEEKEITAQLVSFRRSTQFCIVLKMTSIDLLSVISNQE